MRDGHFRTAVVPDCVREGVDHPPQESYDEHGSLLPVLPDGVPTELAVSSRRAYQAVDAPLLSSIWTESGPGVPDAESQGADRSLGRCCTRAAMGACVRHTPTPMGDTDMHVRIRWQEARLASD